MNDTLAELVSHLGMLAPGSMPALSDAITTSGKLIEETWKGYLMGGAIPGSPYRIKNPTGGAARSVKMKHVGSHRVIIYSENRIVSYIEDGTKELDMKTTHPYGPKSRQGKNGPYLIVPFRHGTPTASRNPMPAKLYMIIKNALKSGEVEKSTVESNEAYKSPNAVNLDPNKKAQEKHQFKEVSRHGYRWGGSLKGLPESMKNYEGMVIMDTSSGKSNSSAYFTFRVISVNSKKMSWIKPAQPAMKLTEHVIRNTRETIEDLMEFALRKDLGL